MVCNDALVAVYDEHVTTKLCTYKLKGMQGAAGQWEISLETASRHLLSRSTGTNVCIWDVQGIHAANYPPGKLEHHLGNNRFKETVFESMLAFCCAAAQIA